MCGILHMQYLFICWLSSIPSLCNCINFAINGISFCKGFHLVDYQSKVVVNSIVRFWDFLCLWQSDDFWVTCIHEICCWCWFFQKAVIYLTLKKPTSLLSVLLWTTYVTLQSLGLTFHPPLRQLLLISMAISTFTSHLTSEVLQLLLSSLCHRPSPWLAVVSIVVHTHVQCCLVISD